MEILILGSWSQGPRELDLRGNQGLKECPRQSAICCTWRCCCGWANGRLRRLNSPPFLLLLLSHLQLQQRGRPLWPRKAEAQAAVCGRQGRVEAWAAFEARPFCGEWTTKGSKGETKSGEAPGGWLASVSFEAHGKRHNHAGQDKSRRPRLLL